MRAWELSAVTIAVVAGWLLAADLRPARAGDADYTLIPFWTDTIAASGGQVRAFTEMLRLDDGGLTLVGEELELSATPSDLAHGSRLIVVSIAPNGAERWRQSLIMGESDNGPHLAPAPEGGVFVCDGGAHYYRLDADGEMLWHREYEHWREATCRTMAYHPAGLLAVAGARTTSNGFHRQASLTAYRVQDGEIAWSVLHRPYEGDVHQPSSYEIDRVWARVDGDRIDWLGWGYVTRDSNRHYFPWSFVANHEGTLIEATPVSKFMAAWRKIEHTAIAFTPPHRTVLFNRESIDSDLAIWVDENWRTPLLRQSGFVESFRWLWDEPLPALAAVGGSDDDMTLLFHSESNSRRSQDRIDIVTLFEDRWRPPLTLSVAFPDRFGRYRIAAVCTVPEFALGKRDPIYLLVEEAGIPWRIDQLTLR